MIIPSILTDSVDVAQKQLATAKKIGLTRVQIDIVDGQFADELTLYPIDIVELGQTDVQIDIHLMTNDPINDVVECAQIPGILTIIGQIEHMPSQKDFFEHVESFGIQSGLSLDYYTDIDALDTSILDSVSLVQVMANKAGRQGEEFGGQTVLEKIHRLHTLRREKKYSFSLCVDIGMNPETVKQCEGVGADQFAVGSYLWNAQDPQSALDQLRSSL